MHDDFLTRTWADHNSKLYAAVDKAGWGLRSAVGRIGARLVDSVRGRPVVGASRLKAGAIAEPDAEC